MLARSLAVAISFATMLLTGCQTFKLHGFVPPDQRSQHPLYCPIDRTQPCDVTVDPSMGVWVPENIWANPGGIINFRLAQGYEFEGPGISLKDSATPPPMVCEGAAPRLRTCRVNGRSKVAIGYKIHVRGKEIYDPFVWPR